MHVRWATNHELAECDAAGLDERRVNGVLDAPGPIPFGRYELQREVSGGQACARREFERCRHTVDFGLQARIEQMRLECLAPPVEDRIRDRNHTRAAVVIADVRV